MMIEWTSVEPASLKRRRPAAVLQFWQALETRGGFVPWVSREMLKSRELALA